MVKVEDSESNDSRALKEAVDREFADASYGYRDDIS